MPTPATIRPAEIRAMTPDERKRKLAEIREELMVERGFVARGGAPRSPGKLRALRTTIARILTIQHQYGEV